MKWLWTVILIAALPGCRGNALYRVEIISEHVIIEQKVTRTRTVRVRGNAEAPAEPEEAKKLPPDTHAADG